MTNGKIALPSLVTWDKTVLCTNPNSRKLIKNFDVGGWSCGWKAVKVAKMRGVIGETARDESTDGG